MANPISRTLRAMKRRGGERVHAKMAGKQVSIWSGEHHAWWRHDGAGYTDDKAQAWVLAFEEAYRTTVHCGSEKRIVYVEVQQ
jgi:hypothetical protein